MIFLNSPETPSSFAEFCKDFCARTRGENNNAHKKLLQEQVAAIIADVQQNGDEALIRYAKKFDDIELTPDQFIINMEDVDAESLALSDDEKAAIRMAHERISAFAAMTKPREIERTGESYVAQKYVPLDRVACYVPCGSFPLVSTVLHTCVFAHVAGVEDIIVLTSPKKEGIYPAMLYAAKVAGVRSIVQLGGVYGVAAVAYGTQTIKKVQSIAGPGNAYVTEAKKQVFGAVNIDMLAGPSEIMIIADDTANPEYVAADLLSQAEHGSGMEQAVLVTISASLTQSIQSCLLAQRQKLPPSAAMDRVIENGIFVINCKTIEDCAQICNHYAPEHVEILTKDPDYVEKMITSAGAIMMGEWTPEPIGDFVAGSSHVLPTGGAAKIFSGLTTAHFMKKIGIQKFNQKTLGDLRFAAEKFAQMEQLPAHGRSVSIRFDAAE